MCPPGYYHSGFVATHTLGHMIYGYYIITSCLYLHKNNDYNILQVGFKVRW